jgi:hypothetical protein
MDAFLERARGWVGVELGATLEALLAAASRRGPRDPSHAFEALWLRLFCAEHMEARVRMAPLERGT